MIVVYFIYNILMRVIEVYYILLGLYALLSWFPGAYHTWLGKVVRYFVDPIIQPIRKLRLQVGLLDFSVLVVFVLLNMSRYFLTYLYTLWMTFL